MKAEPRRSECRCAELGASAEAAAILLAFSMRETESPVGELGAALERMSRALTLWRRRAIRAQAPQRPGEQDHPTTLFEQDLTLCIRSLQFHDRLIQQLAVIRNLLTTLADHPILEMSGFGAQRWEQLLQSLRDRLTQDSAHGLFERLLETGEVSAGSGSSSDLEGSVELF